MKYLILVCVILLSGCRPAIKLMYGFKKPYFETPGNIEKFKGDMFGDSVPYFILKYESFVQNEILRIPEVFVFDRYGNYIPYRDSLKPNCNGPAEQFMEQLDSNRVYHVGNDFTLDSFIGQLEQPGCSGEALFKDNGAYFKIFMTWMNQSGKQIYREKSRQWLRKLKENKQITYQLHMINCDFQMCWPDKQKDVFGIKY